MEKYIAELVSVAYKYLFVVAHRGAGQFQRVRAALGPVFLAWATKLHHFSVPLLTRTGGKAAEPSSCSRLLWLVS